MSAPQELNVKLIIAISSRALFNLDESNQIFEQEGVETYAKYQITNEKEVLEPGLAFPLVKKLLQLQHPETQKPLVEVILLSRNSADTGLRIFNSIKHHDLRIKRAAFTSGGNPYQYINAYGADLFLSTNPQDVQNALNASCAAATILSGQPYENQSDKLHIAFDGDAVLFSDEAERVYQTQGLEQFNESEINAAEEPLAAGPFKPFLAALHEIQSLFPDKELCPIRTALVTARSAPAHERVIKTLRSWNIRIDESLFLGGLTKAEFLHAFGADFFFDDQHGHCDSARNHVPTGHVPHGVTNEDKNQDQ